MNFSINFWKYFILFNTFLYSFIHFQTFSYNSEILPCQVCKKVNVIKHRKPYKNVYFCKFPYIFSNLLHFYTVLYIFIQFNTFSYRIKKKNK